MASSKIRIDLHLLRFQRLMNQSDLPKAEKRDGVWICRWCGGECPGRKRCWCSKECLYEYMIRSSARYARRQVEKRDKRICAICEVDTDTSREEGQWDVLWHMDHIIPVVEGGGCCGLDNLRTLCLWCHKEETADLASRRALKARTPQNMQLELI